MRRAVIQIGDNRIAYDGREWTPLEGEHASVIAKVMKMSEELYWRKASSQPDSLYNVALEAAREFKGDVIEFDPLAPSPPDRIH